MADDRMTVLECEDRAKDEGFDRATFDLVGPGGRRKCRWIDAYMGMIQPEGQKGFILTRDLKGLPLWCENFSDNRPKAPK